jgi:hypothetical protein
MGQALQVGLKVMLMLAGGTQGVADLMQAGGTQGDADAGRWGSR